MIDSHVNVRPIVSPNPGSVRRRETALTRPPAYALTYALKDQFL
jgi:hypothetical protein